MEGRETGSYGQRKAAGYIQDQFRKIGLYPIDTAGSYQQYYPLYQDTMERCSLVVNNIPAVYGIDMLCSLNTNISQTLNDKDLVFVGYGIDDSLYSDYGKKNVKNKIVVFFSGEPKLNDKYIITGNAFMSDWSHNLSKKLWAARYNGAAAALYINTFQENFSKKEIETSLKTKLSFKQPQSGEILNYAILSHAFAKNIFGEKYSEIINVSKNQQAFVRSQKKIHLPKVNFTYVKNRNIVYASNVLGYIEGSEKKDEYVFVTGHYDHLGKHEDKLYYGADDDGSGTTAVIAMAGAFARATAAGYRPKRTIVFMTVSGEEKGLWGSNFYSEHPIFPLNKTSVDLNIDMIGRIDTERQSADSLNYIYVIGHDKISSELASINEYVNNKYTQLSLDYKFDDPADKERIYYRSDHYNFAKKGIPVLFFYDGMLQGDYHKPTDTIDKIYWNIFEKRVHMIFLTAWEIANKDNLLNRDKPLANAGR